MPIQLHIQKMKREADVIKKNEKSANDYLTQTKVRCLLTFYLLLDIMRLVDRLYFIGISIYAKE